MDEKKTTDEGYSLYTEKIILSPKVKYKKLIKFLKFIGYLMIFISMTGALLIFIKSYKEKKKQEEKKPAEFVIERDQYYFDDQYSEDNLEEDNIKADYETLLATLRTKVENVQKSIVCLDASFEVSEFSELDGKNTNGQAGAVIAHINSKYMILASISVTKEWSDIVVRLSDAKQIAAEVVCVNEDTGISILSIDEEDIPESVKSNLQVAKLGNSYNMRQGDMVIVAGRLYGVSGSVDYATITNVSTVYDVDNGYEIFDTNLTKSEADYGFVFNSAGSIVGVTMTGEDKAHKVVGISDMKTMLEKMINTQQILYFGVKAQNVTDDLAEIYNLPTGVYVSAVERNSPAYDAGIQPGDVIVSLNENEALTIQEFNAKLYQCEPGDTITVSVKRYGKEGYNDVTFDAIVGVR